MKFKILQKQADPIRKLHDKLEIAKTVLLNASFILKDVQGKIIHVYLRPNIKNDKMRCSRFISALAYNGKAETPTVDSFNAS